MACSASSTFESPSALAACPSLQDYYCIIVAVFVTVLRLDTMWLIQQPGSLAVLQLHWQNHSCLHLQMCQGLLFQSVLQCMHKTRKANCCNSLFGFGSSSNPALCSCSCSFGIIVSPTFDQEFRLLLSCLCLQACAQVAPRHAISFCIHRVIEKV